MYIRKREQDQEYGLMEAEDPTDNNSVEQSPYKVEGLKLRLPLTS